MVSKPRLINALLVGSACISASLPLLARADDALSEVFVTARKQDENVQTVPIAMTVVSEESMKTMQVHNVGDIQHAAPSLAITNNAPATAGYAFASMRGIANLQAGTENDPAVAIYLDGVFIASPAMGMLDLNDVQNVEVLRGPQGTLFGRAAIGGALNITTKQPTQTFEGFIKGDIGNYMYKDISGMLNVPLTDSIAARVTAHHKEHAGYVTNGITGDEMANQIGDDFVRAQVLYDVNDKWDMTLAGSFNRMSDDGLGIMSSGTGGPLTPLAPVLNQYLHQKSDWWTAYGGDSLNGPNKDYLKTHIVSYTLNGDLGWAQLKSITAEQMMNTYGGNDLDGTPVDILYSLTSYGTRTFTEELQLSGEVDKLSWVTGLYYLKLNGKEESTYQFFGAFGSPRSRNSADVESESDAAFVQTYYNFTDELRLTAGARWTRDVRDADLHNFSNITDATSCAAGNVTDPTAFDSCSQKVSKTFNYPAYTFGLDYQYSPDGMVYIKTSRAALAGGISLRIGGTDATFDPEVVKDVEIGAKSDWLDHHLRTDVALFHSWLTKVQSNISSVVDVGGNQVTTQLVRNAGDAQISGLEFQATALPWDNMEISASIGLVHAEWDSGTYIEQQGVTIAAAAPTPAGCTDAGPASGGTRSVNCSTDKSGEDLPQAPELTYNIGATQKFPLSFGEVSAHLDYSYIGDQRYAPVTAAAQQPDAVKAMYDQSNQLDKAKGYGLLNGIISLNVPNPDVTISLWGKNLADTKYVDRTFADLYTGAGFAMEFAGTPRTYGISAEYRFK